MSTNYKKAGVDIKKANKFISSIKKMKGERSSAVLTDIGQFSGLFALDKKKYKKPVITASCDGVGTKLKLAFWLNKHRTIGIDLVAMNVNDLVTSGASPCFFLDYISTTKLDNTRLKDIVRGIDRGCKKSGCALLGGETAQMPGIYKQDEYDVAGFAVGVVDKKDIIDGSKIKAGDVIIGLASNGIHSNGYSLVRSVFSKDYLIKNSNLFYRPTKIYVRAILALKEKVKIKGIAHITGGGFYDNIERILPKKICAEIDVNSWQIPKVFNLIQNKAKLSKKEMFGTFNMGIGMVVIISRKDTKKALNILDKNNVTSSVIGNCQPGKKSKVIII